MLAGAALLLTTALASAPDEGPRIFVSLERLFGAGVIDVSQVRKDGTMPEVSSSGTYVAAFRSSSSNSATAPRLGLDLRVAGGLTLGGALGLVYGGDSTADRTRDGLGFFADARVGYYYRLSDSFAVWPRLGMSYAKAASGGGLSGVPQGSADLSTTTVSLVPELALVLSVFDHLAFTASLIGDVALYSVTDASAGDGSSTELDNDLHHYGVMFGLSIPI